MVASDRLAVQPSDSRACCRSAATGPCAVDRRSVPEERARDEFFRDQNDTVLARLERELLREHDVSRREVAHRQEAQAAADPPAFIELADIHGGAGIDPVAPSAM